jgi:prolyl-tRNA synthetase
MQTSAKFTQFFLPTLRENPANEPSRNAQLLLRGGFIHKEMAGVYSFLPLGLRVLEKIKEIVRDEMTKANGQELWMSALSPRENWEKTARWENFDVLYKMHIGGQEANAALCPTHEEIVTPLIKEYISSYKQLPLCVYQFQSKFRNEARAKSGLLRCREFLMKDAYSFHTNNEDFEAYYNAMMESYQTIYKNLGIGEKTLVVKASGGAFSQYSHEFQTLTPVGEDDIYIDTVTGDAYNKEIAQGLPDTKNSADAALALETFTVERPADIKNTAKILECPEWQILKNVVLIGEKGQAYMASIRGDLEVNELVLGNVVNDTLRPATEEELTELGLIKGFIAPIGLKNADKFVFIADESTKTVSNFFTGANALNTDLKNVNFVRDVPNAQWANFAVPTADFTTLAGNPLKIEPAVEVGNIFPLATKFSDAFDFKYLDQNGKAQPVVMGCYGIGISRLMGVIAEVYADEKGLQWPTPVAPFQVHIMTLGRKDEAFEASQAIYDQLTAAGIEVLYDDRREKKISPGQKFKDYEMIGCPIKIIISPKTVEEQMAEVGARNTEETQQIPLKDLFTHIQTLCN